MLPRLIAFDLDGTLLTSGKKLSGPNRAAIREMARAGIIPVLASGRLGSSMMQYTADLAGVDFAMLTLNGAEVYAGDIDSAHLVYSAGLPRRYAEVLVDYAAGEAFALNYYTGGVLHSVRTGATAPWIDLYIRNTGTAYRYVDALPPLIQKIASKIIFVGDPSGLDEIEREFRARWDEEIYIVRTWDYYLEFLNRRANKGNGLEALARHYGCALAETAVFGDADNDIPMLEKAGLGIAMRNASHAAKRAADRVSPWTNDQDGVAREWEEMKQSPDR